MLGEGPFRSDLAPEFALKEHTDTFVDLEYKIWRLYNLLLDLKGFPDIKFQGPLVYTQAFLYVLIV